MYKTRGGKKKGITYDCKAVAWEQSCASNCKIETHPLSQLPSKNASPEMPPTLQLKNSLTLCVFTLVDCMPLATQSRAKIEIIFRCDQSACGWI